ncbi:MAG: IS4 family transposase, partial [Actinophytocola sp.]|nr:IS4 family transposase [Actinophytocola sp.]
MSYLRDVLQESDGQLTDRVAIGVLTRVVPRDLVDEVLNYTGKNEKRARLLPARVVVYYVLALTLFSGDAYEEVLRKLVNGLRFLRAWRTEWDVPTTGAISKARIRLGAKPLE